MKVDQDMTEKAWFMVRAEIADPTDRPAFDRWYETEHLPDAQRIFQAELAWRCWSDIDPSIHYAFYQFASLEAARAVPQSAGIRSLIAEFDRVWGSRVTRTRDILGAIQVLPARTPNLT
jgi:hypothetical protein